MYDQPQPQPRPLDVQVCSVCRQPWTGHVRTATDRWHDWMDDDNAGAPGDTVPDVAVDLRDCVLALQDANRGPQGPVGVMGATGERGAKGERGRDAGEAQR